MIVRRAIWNMTEVALTALTLFVIYKLVVSRLGISALGVYSLVLATTSIARIGDLGMAATLTRFVARAGAIERDDIAPLVYVETAFVANLVLYTLLGAALLWPLSHALKWALHGAALDSARHLLPYAIVNFALLNISGVAISALTGFHRSDLKSRLAIFSVVLLLTISYFTVSSLGLIGLAVGQMVQNGFMAISGWLFSRRLARHGRRPLLPWRIDRPALKEVLGFGLRLQLTNVVGMIYEPATKFALSALAGPAELGIFEMAYRAVVQARAIIVAPSQNLTPMFAAIHQSDVKDREHLYNRSVVMFGVGGAFGFVAVIAISPLISLFLIHRIDPMFIEMVAVLCAGLFVNILGVAAYVMANADGRIRWNIVGTAVASFGSPVLAYSFWHLGGSIGFVTGFSLATALGATVFIVANPPLVELKHSVPPLESWTRWLRVSKTLLLNGARVINNGTPVDLTNDGPITEPKNSGARMRRS